MTQFGVASSCKYFQANDAIMMHITHQGVPERLVFHNDLSLSVLSHWDLSVNTITVYCACTTATSRLQTSKVHTHVHVSHTHRCTPQSVYVHIYIYINDGVRV